MTIHLELSPEVEAHVAAEAEARGIAPEEYAGGLLKDLLAVRPNPSGRLTVEELHIMLAEIAEGSEKLPNPPTSSFTRESFYEDRT